MDDARGGLDRPSRATPGQGSRRGAPIATDAPREHHEPFERLHAGFAVATSTFENSHHMAPWTGFAVFAVFAVFAGYAALAVVVAAAFGLVRRDA